MCGIAGVVGPNATAAVLDGMLWATAHRGEPDYRNETAVATGYALGTNRLAIVDEAHGRQPVRSAAGTVVCVINGEIYNHAELRAELAGYPFTSACDSEVVLAAYLTWGTEAVGRLRGMFGLAIHDARTDELILARDPLGIKPLYVGNSRQDTFFASELKAFAHLDAVSTIREVQPGTMLVSGRELPYWHRPVFGRSSRPASGPAGGLDAVLRDAVRSHLGPRDRQIACLLSGGIDSSTVLMLAHELRPGAVEAWTFSTGAEDSGDLAAAREVCDHLGVRLRMVTPTAQTLTDLYLTAGVWMTETWEPALVRNAVSYHVLCRAVCAAGYKYALSGEGADEVFGGYDYFARLPERQRDPAVASSLAEIHRTYLQMSDRSSMYATLEVRVPFMDRHVVEFAAALPTAARFRDGVNKWALRELYPGRLPDGIRYRPKLGMNAGAGFGSNDPGDGIYDRAVRTYYRRSPDRWRTDHACAMRLGPDHGVDPGEIEEVFTFARYVEHGFHRLALRPRPQLNVSTLREGAVGEKSGLLRP